MEECRYFTTCQEIHADLINLKNTDVEHTSSMKSLHKRQDKADDMRDELSSDIHGVSSLVSQLVKDLSYHMQQEEELAKTKMEHKIDLDKRTAKRLTIYMWLGGFLFTCATMFTTYIFNSIDATKKDMAAMKQYTLNKDKRDDKMEVKIENISTMLYTLNGKFGDE